MALFPDVHLSGFKEVVLFQHRFKLFFNKFSSKSLISLYLMITKPPRLPSSLHMCNIKSLTKRTFTWETFDAMVKMEC